MYMLAQVGWHRGASPGRGLQSDSFSADPHVRGARRRSAGGGPAAVAAAASARGSGLRRFGPAPAPLWPGRASAPVMRERAPDGGAHGVAGGAEAAACCSVGARAAASKCCGRAAADGACDDGEGERGDSGEICRGDYGIELEAWRRGGGWRRGTDPPTRRGRCRRRVRSFCPRRGGR